MTPWTRGCALFLFCFLVDWATGQDAAGSAPESDAAAHSAIRELRDALIAAVNDRDVDAVLEQLHPEVVLTAQDGETLATIRGRDRMRDYIDRLLTGPDAGVERLTVNPVVDELTILHGGDAGVAYGSSADNYRLRDGAEFTLNTRWSATVVSDNGRWKLASLHVSTNLFDNPVLDAYRQFVLLAVIAAGVAGLLIGYGASRIRRGASGRRPVPPH